MDKTVNRALSIVGILRDALKAYGRHFIPIVALYCLNTFLFRLFQLMQPLTSGIPAGFVHELASFFVFCVWLFLIGIAGFLNIVIIYYVKSEEKVVSFSAAFQDAAGRIGAYLKAYALQVLLMLAFFLPGFLAQTAGQVFYQSRSIDLSSHARLVILLISSTIFVTLFIAGCWYFFFYSLGPLVNAFEKLGARRALQESRARIKGNALRYLTVFIIIILLYIIIGTIILAIMQLFTQKMSILRKVDPVLMTLFFPWAIAAWWGCYKKLSELKTTQAE